LVILSGYGGDGTEGCRQIKESGGTTFAQDNSAAVIGTTRPRVSHFMNKFRKLGFIKYNGHIEVHSSLLSILLDD